MILDSHGQSITPRRCLTGSPPHRSNKAFFRSQPVNPAEPIGLPAESNPTPAHDTIRNASSHRQPNSATGSYSLTTKLLRREHPGRQP